MRTRVNIYRRLRKHILFSKWFMFSILLFPLCITAVSTVSPYLYKTLVDDVMTNKKIDLLYVIIPCMVAVYVLKFTFTAIHTNINLKFANSTNAEVKRQLMEQFLSRDIDMLSDEQVGVYSSNLETDSEAVYDFLSNHMIGYATKFIITGIYLVLMLYINPWLGLLSVVLVPATIFFSRKIGTIYNRIVNARFEVKASTRSHLFNTIQRWKEIKANTLEESFSSGFDERLEPERRLNGQWMRYYALNEFIYMIKTEFIMKVLIYFAGGLFIIVKQITIGELLMFIAYMESMYASLDTLMKSNSDFMGNKAVYDRMFAILEEQQSKRSIGCPTAPDIVLEGVTFSYETSRQNIFDAADFSFEWGKKYLLIGKSGEGKSTLIKLILGMIQPQAGEMMLHQVPIKDIDPKSLLQQVGTVMQDNAFFNLTIRENLLLVAPEAADADLMQVLRTACLDEFIESLPQKLDTIIGERGIKLSGGQKQRLAIARLLLHHPQIVILDEATSALDSVVEGRIMENLNRCFAGHTMIVISHKPLMGYMYDAVVGIENQRIEEVRYAH